MIHRPTVRSVGVTRRADVLLPGQRTRREIGNGDRFPRVYPHFEPMNRYPISTLLVF